MMIDQTLREIHPNSFKTFRMDRETTNETPGGGLMLIVPEDLNPKVRKDLNLIIENYFKVCGLNLTSIAKIREEKDC